MRVTTRLSLGAAFVALTLGVPVPVEGAAAVPVVSSATVEVGQSVVLTPDEDRASASSESDTSPIRPFLGLVLIATVFVVGLRAIKRQRDEGRRSKLPPIG